MGFSEENVIEELKNLSTHCDFFGITHCHECYFCPLCNEIAEGKPPRDWRMDLVQELIAEQQEKM